MIATIEPTSFTQGDSLGWQKSFVDYPATEWTLTYYIRGVASLNVTATPQNTAFLIALTAIQTATLNAGNYWWQAVATKGNERVTVGKGQWVVAPNIQTAGVNYDGRSHVKKTLDALEAVIEKRASLDQQSYSIQGRSLSRMSVDDLMTWREKYRGFYRDELKVEKAAAGLGRGNKVQVRFNS